MPFESGKVQPVFVPVKGLALKCRVFGQNGAMLRQQARMKLTSSVGHDLIGTFSVTKIRRTTNRRGDALNYLRHPSPRLWNFGEL